MTAGLRAALLLPALAALLTACQAGTDSQGAPDEGLAPQVRTVPVETIEYERRLRLPGVVKPGRRAVLSTRTSGTVRRVPVVAGDAVSSGRTLLEVESRDLEAALDAERLRRDAATAAAEKAERDVERLERLFADDLIALGRLEDARLLLEQRWGELAAARAAVQARRVGLDYARIRAPFDGIVSEVLADTGSFVGPGTPLLVLEDRDGFEVDAGVTQRTADRLGAGQPVTVSLPGAGRLYHGTLRAVIPALEEGGAGSLIRVAIEGDSAGLRPGQVVEVALPGGDPPRTAWRVPADAVFTTGQLHGVFLAVASADGATARLRWVELAPADSGRESHRVVLEGLAGGGRVIVGDATEHLRDGQSIRVAGEKPGDAGDPER